jgi:hypothetical protein
MAQTKQRLWAGRFAREAATGSATAAGLADVAGVKLVSLLSGISPQGGIGEQWRRSFGAYATTENTTGRRNS